MRHSSQNLQINAALRLLQLKLLCGEETAATNMQPGKTGAVACLQVIANIPALVRRSPKATLSCTDTMLSSYSS
jgi:hypothetical protein